MTAYHLFERKYTGLANKDAGDFDGELNFIFLTFNPFEDTNPEAAIGENIFEMSTVTVVGWGDYQPCNAPGCTGSFTCPADNGDYCCTNGHSPAHNTNTTLPGRKRSGGGGDRRRRKSDTTTGAPTTTGYWYSFPRESEGVTWTEVSVDRRINSSCLAEAWRSDAGGCPQCDDLASQCVGNCIKSALSRDQLKATWDQVFANSTMCPDVPLPEPPAPTPPTPPTPPVPTPPPTPVPTNCNQNRDEQACTSVGCSWCTFGSQTSFGFCRSQCTGEVLV